MISRYFHTIRYLKPKQIYRRIWFHLIRPSIDESPSFYLRDKKNVFCLPVQKKPSLILVPMLAFDKNGVRLGYGKGFYDRFFEKNKNQ